MRVWICSRCQMPAEAGVQQHGARRLCPGTDLPCSRRDASLDEAIGIILSKLRLLADGKTQNLDPNRVTQHGAESRVPQGVTLREVEPKKHRVSLYEFYRWQFDHTADDDTRRTLWELAWDDYEDFRFKADHLIAVKNSEELENDPHDGGKAERVEADRVINWYEGRSPLYVATRENQMGAIATEAWVRKVRRERDRNPDDGRPLPEFRKWDEDRRREEVERLAAQGKGAKAIATHFGVSKNTVKRYLDREPVAA